MKITFKKIAIALIVLVIIGGIIQERNGSKNTTATPTAGRGSTFQSLVGKPAPSFTLSDRSGNTITNDNLKGKKVLLFFNEGLACYPACWNQMLEFNKDERLKQDDTVILSVVTDTVNSWQQATEKMSDLATINVAFDKGGVSKDFGATTVPSTMHEGVPGHSYVIIDKDGVVRWVLDDPKMAINNGEIYAQLSKLQ
ncbi:MAG: redoxin domain-containing protein [Candidatus Moranbacteria bacterium]|nr:redoxin domain-containing protein [Candidatus Moranbacteria bacterium]